MLGLMNLFLLKGVRCQDFAEILPPASSEREREREFYGSCLLWSTSVTPLLPTMAKGGESGLGRARKERAEDTRGTMGNELRVEHPWYANCLPCTSYEHPNCIARHSRMAWCRRDVSPQIFFTLII